LLISAACPRVSLRRPSLHCRPSCSKNAAGCAGSNRTPVLAPDRLAQLCILASCEKMTAGSFPGSSRFQPAIECIPNDALVLSFLDVHHVSLNGQIHRSRLSRPLFQATPAHCGRSIHKISEWQMASFGFIPRYNRCFCLHRLNLSVMLAVSIATPRRASDLHRQRFFSSSWICLRRARV
jgi:hypothetical protein